MSVSQTDRQTIGCGAVHDLVVSWFHALDRHDPVAALEPFLVPDGLELRLPGETRHGLSGFRSWYDTVTHRFFDETHRVDGIGVTRHGDVTTAEIRVNWQARTWRPPAERSNWIGFDAEQTWHLVTGADGKPVVRTYVVTALNPMPGSADI